MASDFYRLPEAKLMMEEADDILHEPLTKIMLEGPAEVLVQTQYTQPAIFLHSALALKFLEIENPPTAAAGHSLGEFTALYCARVFTFSDALKLVYERGKLMFEAGKRSEGTMAAIIGMENSVLSALCNDVETETGYVVRCANFNSPGQIVISGSPGGVREVMTRAKAQGIRIAKELPVSGAFHSPLMQYAADGLREILDSTTMHEPEFAVFSNVTAEPHTDLKSIRSLLVEQLTAPVRWMDLVRNMYDSGIRDYSEIGPGKVLQGLISRTVNDVTIQNYEKLPE
jgi:[acyl-carrier-protein] S-malonyltransferase